MSCAPIKERIYTIEYITAKDKHIGIVLDFFYTKKCTKRYLKAKIKHYQSIAYIDDSITPNELLYEIAKKHSSGLTLQSENMLTQAKIEVWKEHFQCRILDHDCFFQILTGDKIIFGKQNCMIIRNISCFTIKNKHQSHRTEGQSCLA